MSPEVSANFGSRTATLTGPDLTPCIMSDVSKAKIERLSLSELFTLCGQNGLSTAGTRFELAIRLATHLFPEQAAQPLPSPAIVEAWLCFFGV